MAKDIKRSVPLANNPPPVVALLTSSDYSQVSNWKRVSRSMIKARWPVVAVVILVVTLFCAVFAAQLTPKDPNRQALVKRLLPPLSLNSQGQIDFVLGSDTLGRDVLARIIYGA